MQQRQPQRYSLLGKSGARAAVLGTLLIAGLVLSLWLGNRTQRPRQTLPITLPAADEDLTNSIAGEPTGSFQERPTESSSGKASTGQSHLANDDPQKSGNS